MFIAFEGIDGSGKSTLSLKVSEWLTSKGKKVVHTREPRDPYRSLIFDPNISDKEELFLFMADRARHIDKIIRPAIKEGKFVITDRYALSTFAYQVYGKLKPELYSFVSKLHYFTTEEFRYPDLTFILTIDPEVALKRATDKNKFEAKGLEYYKRLDTYYRSETKIWPNAYLIDSSESMEITFNNIINILKDYL